MKIRVKWSSAIARYAIVFGILAAIHVGVVPCDAGTSAEDFPKEEPKSLRDEPAYIRVEPQYTEKVWYGWQNLAVIGASVALAVGGSTAGSPEAAIPIGLAGFYLGPPIVHWSHGNNGTGVASLGLGVGGGLVAGLVGAALNPGDDCPSERDNQFPTYCVNTAPLVGLVYGVAAAGLVYSVVDVAALAWEDVPAGSPEKTNATSYRIVPKVWLAQNQTTFGVSGEF
jgi:hypothetical protein